MRTNSPTSRLDFIRRRVDWLPTKKVNTANSMREKADCRWPQKNNLSDTMGEFHYQCSGRQNTFSNARVLKSSSHSWWVQVDVGHIPLQLHHVRIIRIYPTFSKPSSRYTMEIVGVIQLRKYFYCLQCNKKNSSWILCLQHPECHYCSLTQKGNRWKECHVYTKVSQDDSQFAITFFHEEIEEIFNILRHKNSVGKALITKTARFSTTKCHL